MTSICLYFKVHQPYRLKRYEAKDIDACHCYEDPEADKANINRLADQCWLPANEIIYRQLLQHKGRFRCSFSISGVTLELMQRYRPDVIDSFRKLAATGYVDFTGESYYHSLSSLYAPKEVQREVLQHTKLISQLFDISPIIFRNTELIHDNRIATLVSGLGFKALLCEGVDRILKGRNANEVYAAPGADDLYLLLRNARLSDDIAFHFNDPAWSAHPLTAAKFAEWLHQHPAGTGVINLFMNYETFGVHKKPETGIFDFLDSLPAAVLANDNFVFSTAEHILEEKFPKGLYDVPQTMSWEDHSASSCAWCENVMQNNTLKKIYSIENLVMHSTDQRAAALWGRLQAADYFYSMAEDSRRESAAQHVADSSPREVFQHYTNIVADFEISLIKKVIEGKKSNSRRIPFNILSH